MPGGAAMGLVVALTPADRPHARASSSWRPARRASTRPRLRPTCSRRGAAPESRRPCERHQSAARQRRRSTRTAATQLDPARRTAANGRIAVQIDALEDYVAQVRGRRRRADAPAMRAQQALAITARTFALANRNRHRREGFDLCDTTHCQVLRPATATTRRAATRRPRPRAAARGPAGVRLLFRVVRRPVGARLGGLAGRHRLSRARSRRTTMRAATEPGGRASLRAEAIERALRAAGLRGDRLRDLPRRRATPRRGSSRLRVDGFTPAEISGHDFRMAVGRVAGGSDQEHRLRRAPHGRRLSLRGPRLRPRRRVVRDRRGPAARARALLPPTSWSSTSPACAWMPIAPRRALPAPPFRPRRCRFRCLPRAP